MAKAGNADRGLFSRTTPDRRVLWYARLSDGRRMRKFGPFYTKDDARSFYYKAKTEQAAGIFQPEKYHVRQRAVLVEEYAQLWLDWAHGQGGLKPSTLAFRRSLLQRHLLPRFGKSHIEKVTRTHVRAFIGWLQEKGLSPSAICNVILQGSSVFQLALEDHVIPANPFRGHRGLSRQRWKRKVDILTEHEEDVLLAACRTKLPQHYCLVLLFLRTGLRPGEVSALHRTDPDLDRRTLFVQRTLWRNTIGTPKSGKSRTVDLSPRLVDVLGAHLRKQELDAMEAEKAPPPQIFPGPKGYMEYWYLTRCVLASALKVAALRRSVTPKIFRHTFASRLLMAGHPVHYVKEQMGHASITTTVDTYGHFIPSPDTRPVDTLDRPIPPDGQF